MKNLPINERAGQTMSSTDRTSSRTMFTARMLASTVSAMSLAGCAVGPAFHPPAAPTTRAYTVAQPTVINPENADDVVQRISLGVELRADWWTLLGSPQLNDTVTLALNHNKTLAEASANLASAEQGIAAARGRLRPQVDASSGIERRKVGAYSFGPEAFTFPKFSAYTGGAEVSYDLDLFGGNRRGLEQATAQAEVERQRLAAAHLDVAGAVVIQALQIAAIRAQMATIERIIASDQKTYDLVGTAQSVGVATRIDITTARTQLDRDRALLPPLRQQLDVAQNALAVLVGQTPADYSAPAFDLAGLKLPADVPLVIPSDLVRVRPDIRAAEAELHAANAAVGIATADLYPRLNLSAEIAGQGLVSGGFASAWGLIGGLAGPIFHGGTLTARKRQAVAEYDASFARYQQTVLVAFRQIADALRGMANTTDAIAAQQRALVSASEALELTRHGFADGNTGIVQVLDAQRLEQLAESDIIQARAQRYVQTVTLFLAIGGGIERAPPPPTPEHQPS
jgi:NodT family efflux transporter outer membrane factor (OMF) lipoprotein